MAENLFIAFAVATTLDIVALGLTASFFDRGFSIGKFIVRFMVTSLVVALLALGGVLLGQIGTHYVNSSTCIWLASSLMFLLSVKAVYDGLKTAKLKRSINPTVFSGLLSLSVLAGINTFLYSLGFGLMNVGCGVVLWFFPLCLDSVEPHRTQADTPAPYLQWLDFRFGGLVWSHLYRCCKIV